MHVESTWYSQKNWGRERWRCRPYAGKKSGSLIDVSRSAVNPSRRVVREKDGLIEKTDPLRSNFEKSRPSMTGRDRISCRYPAFFRCDRREWTD